jgi:uncharacterized membrane protein
MHPAIEIALRWMHILAAITAVGGAIFMRLALLPAVEKLDDATRRQLHEEVRRRWSKVVAASVLFLLISGIVNIVLTIRNPEIELARYYHPLFGIKFLLAFGVFFLASILSGRSEAAAKFQANARFWLTVNVVLAVTIVCISGVLRSGKTVKPAEEADKPAAVSMVFGR